MIRRHDHIVRIDAIAAAQALASEAPPVAVTPPVERRIEFVARDRQRIPVQHAHIVQVEHHFGHGARHVNLHRRMITRAIGQGVDQARRTAVDADPIFDARRLQAGRVRDSRDMQK